MAARAAGQPIFSMKTSSQASMVKALRSLAGIDPSPLSLRDASAVVRPPIELLQALTQQDPLCCYEDALWLTRFLRMALHWGPACKQ